MLRLLRRKYVDGSEKKPPFLNLGLLSKYFTLDIITSLGFGNARGYLNEETDHYDYIHNVKDLWPLFATSAAVPVVRKILVGSDISQTLRLETNGQIRMWCNEGVSTSPSTTSALLCLGL